MTSESSVTHKKNSKQELNRFFNSCSTLLQQSKKIGSITSEQLEQTVTESFGLLDSNSFLHFVALNNVSKGHHLFVNFIANALLLINTITSQFKYDRHSQTVISKTTLLLGLSWVKFLQNNVNKPSQTSLSHIAKKAFVLGKTATQNNAEVLRLLSQIGEFNDYKSKSQFTQSTVVVSINVSLLSLGLLTKSKMTISNALSKLPVSKLEQLSKTFVNHHANTISKRLSEILNIGLTVRTHLDRFGFVVNCRRPISQTIGKSTKLSHSTKWTVCTFNQKPFLQDIDIELFKPNEIRFVAVLPALDYAELDSNAAKFEQFEAVAKIEKQLLSFKSQLCLLEPPENLKTLSNLILTSTIKHIAEHLQSDQVTSNYITQYASGINRINKPIKDIKHASALIGLSRLYPVVCTSEIFRFQDEHKFVGSVEAYNKANNLTLLSQKLANDLGAEIPEYYGLVSQVMMHALLMIPKGRYSASVGMSKQSTGQTTTFNEFFAINDNSQWTKLCGQLARQWNLPKQYLALIKDYFNFISGNLDPHVLPRSSKLGIAILCLSQWAFINIQLGNKNPSQNHTYKLLKKLIGYSDAELKQLYTDIIDDLNPYTSLV